MDTTKIKNFFKDIWNQNPVGQVLPGITTQTVNNPHIPSQREIQQREPYGSIPSRILARSTGFSQTQNLSQTLDIGKVQNALRQAERGDTTLLFAYYRDIFLGTGAVASELSKRKLAVLSEPFSILPSDKTNAKNKQAAKAIEHMISHFPSWYSSLTHLMNAILYPVSVCEKTYEPWDESVDGPNVMGIRYKLRKFEPVDYNILTYRLPYLPTGPLNAMPYAIQPAPAIVNNYNNNRPNATVYDPDSWEPNLRFWSVLENGIIIRDMAQLYEPDPDRHFIYRCNLLDGMSRENFGGLGRSVLFWAIMSQMGKDFFLRMMDRYGVPFPVAHVDTSQTDTVAFLEEAFQMSNKLGGLIVNKDAEIEIQQINMAGGAEGHEKFINLCNSQISLLISGQELGSHAKSTGMGSGVANMQNEVRKDIVRYDRITLSTALRDQLFTQYLRINGIEGEAPNITWGAASSEDAETISKVMLNLSNAGLAVKDSDLELISDKLGFSVEKQELEQVDNTNNSGNVQNGNKPKSKKAVSSV